MSDELRERVARLDPMHSAVPTEPTTNGSSRELLETIMSTPTKLPTQPPADNSRRVWTFAAAAVAALVLAVAGGLSLIGGEETPPTAEPPLELVAGGENTISTCIMFSPDELDRVAEIAFEGTVTAVDGDTISLTVDTWFRGEEATEVVLRAPQGMEALIGGIPFEVGSQYLISAQDGTVNYCGFSGPSTPNLRAGFETAFAQG
jgi:hypothetical protein